MVKFSRKTLMLLYLWRKKENRKLKKQKKMWIRKIFQERKKYGEFHLLMKELRIADNEYFFKFYRMTPTKFEDLLRIVGPNLVKSSLRREVIEPGERLSVTLRYLFSGMSQIDLAGCFRISPSSISRIINETTSVIWNCLIKENFVRAPSNITEWKNIAASFEAKWNFHHCIGAIDGKHVVMQAPAKSGSYFFNYKKTHSLVLLAVCDADYQFILVDIGNTGRNSDGGVFSNSDIGLGIQENLLP